MDIIEFAKFKKMFGGGGASAYTAKSRYELPPDATDGSVAILESERANGTWIFHETPEYDFSYHNGMTGFGVYRVRDNNGDELLLVNLTLHETDGGLEIYGFRDGKTRVDIYNPTNLLWSKCPTREVEILAGCEGEIAFLNALKATATRISGGNALYIYENGKWVYKCEIA